MAGVSICIPSYRGAPRLAALFASMRGMLADSSYDEIVVCDDGSTPEAGAQMAYVARASRLRCRVHRRSINRGWTVAANEAIGVTSSEYVLLLDDDVLWPPRLMTVLAHLLTVEAIGVLSWRSCAITATSSTGRPGFLQPATQLAGYCMAFSRSLWEELGGFDARFRTYCADSDFALRATLAGYPSYRVWWPLVPHAEHQCFVDAPELGDREELAARDLAAFAAKWGCSGAAMETRALAALEKTE